LWKTLPFSISEIKVDGDFVDVICNGQVILKINPPNKMGALHNQLPDPTSSSVTPPAGAGGAPSVAADH
jgi:hypothetical protein